MRALGIALLLSGLVASGASAQGETEAWGPEGGVTQPPPEEPLEEAPAADAGEGQSLSLAQRPLTLPSGTLRGDFNFDAYKISELPIDDDVFTSVGLGAAFGVLDDLEVGVLLLPVLFTYEAGFGNMVLDGTFRFLEGPVEIGGRLELVLPTTTDDYDALTFAMGLGVPVLIRLGDKARLDTGLRFAINVVDTGSGNDAVFGLTFPFGFPPKRHPLATRSLAGIPLVFNYNILDSLFVGARTGLKLGDFENLDESVQMPLGFQAGYSLGLDGIAEVIDFVFRFRWPSLVHSEGAGLGNDKASPDVWQINIGVEAHLGLIR